MATLCTVTACNRGQQTAEPTSGINYANLDTTARPGDDFFRYATGHWIDNNPQNPEYPRWGAFTKLDDDNKNNLKQLFLSLGNAANLSVDEQKVADLYQLSMDSVRRNQLGATPLKPYLDEINAVTTRDELLALMAKNHDQLLYGSYIAADEKNAKMNIVSIVQSGLGLGSEKYYLEDNAENKKVIEAYKEYITTVLTLAGYSAEEAEKAFATVYAIEHEMATVTVPLELLRDPEANYNKMDVATLDKTMNFALTRQLNAYGYVGIDSVVVGQVKPVQKACEMLAKKPLDDLKTFYCVRTVTGAASLLSDDFIQAGHKFSCALQGETQLQPLWKRSISLVNGTLGEIVGQLYVKQYFPAEAKERMLKLVENLRISLGQRIDAQTWMSDATKAVAHEKLDAFIVKIGYPDKWEDYTKLVIDPQKNLLDNMVAAGDFFHNLNIEKRLGKPVDNTEWFMTPQTVNAYYNPTTNEICFPAGILQSPFFDMAADDATNLGAIGVVIGHEMTHGFDDQGRQYDKNGNLCQWWLDADVEAFQKPADALADYFSSLEVLPAQGDTPALMANGRQCLGENLADHGGVMVAYNALMNVMAENPLPDENGFTPQQRFFLSYANVWAGIASDEILRRLTMLDVHSVSRLRVNGTLPHIDEWYDAFGITENDKLYIPKDERVSIW